MKHYLLVYCATLMVMVALDMVWLGVVARDFYKNRMGDMLEFHAVPGIVFYVLYAVGIVLFVNGNSSATTMGWQTIALYGALFGFFAYSTYDLTNLATIRGWSVSLAMVDMLWGTIVTGIAACAGIIITRYFEGA